MRAASSALRVWTTRPRDDLSRRVHRIGEKSAVSREVESRRVEEAAFMGAGLITLMKEQPARERGGRRAALVPPRDFLRRPTAILYP